MVDTGQVSLPSSIALPDSEYSLEFYGGTLVAPNVILSATHCLTPTAVATGSQDLLKLTQPRCEIIDVEEHFVLQGTRSHELARKRIS